MQELIIKVLFFIAPLVAGSYITYCMKRYFDKKQQLVAYYGHRSAAQFTDKGLDINFCYCIINDLGNRTITNKMFHLIYVSDCAEKENQWYFIGKDKDGKEIKGYVSDLIPQYPLFDCVKKTLLGKTFSCVNGDVRLILKDKILAGLGFPLDTSQRTPVYTHSLVIKNVGIDPINNVRVGHRVPLPFYDISEFATVYPNEVYTIRKINDEQEIVFSVIVPQGEIVITYMYFPPATCNQINT